MKQTTCQNLWPWINELRINFLKPREAKFQKTARSLILFFAAPITIFRKCNISSASEKAFPGVFGDFFVANLPQKKRCVETQKCTCVLSTGVVKSRALTCPFKKVIWVLGHCRVKTPHIHTSEWDSLFQVFQICLLFTVTVTPSDSDYVNRSAFIQQFRWIHTTPSDDRGHDASHFYHRVHVHPAAAVVVRNRWRL